MSGSLAFFNLFIFNFFLLSPADLTTTIVIQGRMGGLSGYKLTFQIKDLGILPDKIMHENLSA